MKITPKTLRNLARLHYQRRRRTTASILVRAAELIDLHQRRIDGLVRDNRVYMRTAKDLAEDCHRLRAELRDMRFDCDRQRLRADCWKESSAEWRSFFNEQRDQDDE